jgi:tetratricopeptide (TPR) repeat protein
MLVRILILCCVLAATSRSQTPPAPAPESPVVMPAELPLEPADRAAFAAAMQRRDYTRVETILVEAINRETARDPKSKRAAQLLGVAGGVFFLNGEWLNAAISFKKAEAIAPLVERDRFTLAMAYIRLDRRDWAKDALAKLAAEFPRNALYLYWLGRIEYDAQQYRTAIARFEQVIALDPQMMRAYDNLGLCYDYLGQYDEAVKHYNRAIELNRNQPRPSPWPHLNLGVTLLAQNKLSEAESSLREALRADSRLPQAHYHLGLALDKLGKPDEAIRALEQAAALDATYPDPHYTLGLLYQKQGDKVKAQEAFVRFQRLKSGK